MHTYKHNKRLAHAQSNYSNTNQNSGGIGAFYANQPENESGMFYSSRDSHDAQTEQINQLIINKYKNADGEIQ